MTEQEILDGNIIIAEFMGAKPCKQHPNTQLFLTIKDNKNPSLQYWHLLKYHKSWDWLIPVIDKIHSSEEYFEYKKTLGIYNSGVFVNTKFIEVSFDSVIEYIKWYNQNKTPQILENTSKEIKNIKYLFLRFDIREGERVHQHKVLFQTRATNIKFAIHKYLSQYWGESEYIREDRVWWFFNEITLKLVKYEVLTKEKYDFLTKYLDT